jgi:predicted ATPase
MLFRSLRFKNLLSFADTTIELQPLNILIGANASGKSNLIEAIGLLQSLPSSLERAIRAGGGIREWIRKTEGDCEAFIEVNIDGPAPGDKSAYSVKLSILDATLAVPAETFRETPEKGRPKTTVTRSGITFSVGKNGKAKISETSSVFEVYKNPADPTYLTMVGMLLDGIRIYKSFDTGPRSEARNGTSTSAPSDRLEDAGKNLAMVLQQMKLEGTLTRLKEHLSRYAPRFRDVITHASGMFLTFTLEEKANNTLTAIPALRLSDGTLRFLCLLAILCRKTLPPLICIEEPEIGLHPDALGIVADLLIEASERTQLIVTTHSDVLIDYFSSRPEAVVTCERDFDDGTQFRRLDPDELSVWLKDYRLGQLWRSGEIGANVW